MVKPIRLSRRTLRGLYQALRAIKEPGRFGVGAAMGMLVLASCDEAVTTPDAAQAKPQASVEVQAVRPAASEQPVASSGPFSIKHQGFWPAMAESESSPDAVPEGANRWDCKLSPEHPRPVVLVHGTWSNQYDSFAKLSPTLANDGYCVFTFNFGQDGQDALPMKARFGTSALSESVLVLKAFTDRVLDEMSVDKVDMVGWSQGGLLIRSYLQDHGGADPKDPAKNKVLRVVTLGAPHHGTALSGIALLANLLGATEGSADVLGQGPIDQALGSAFLKELNKNGDTVPGIEYTSIYTLFDHIANPVTSSLLKAGPGATVNNVNIQDGCPVDLSDHLALTYTDRVIALTMKGLDPDASHKIPCKIEVSSIQH